MCQFCPVLWRFRIPSPTVEDASSASFCRFISIFLLNKCDCFSISPLNQLKHLPGSFMSEIKSLTCVHFIFLWVMLLPFFFFQNYPLTVFFSHSPPSHPSPSSLHSLFLNVSQMCLFPWDSSPPPTTAPVQVTVILHSDNCNSLLVDTSSSTLCPLCLPYATAP